MAQTLDNLEVQYTYHVHEGNSSTVGGCYNIPYYYYSYPQDVYCYHHNKGSAGYEQGTFYRCNDCGNTAWDYFPPTKIGTTTAYSYGYSVPSNGTEISKTYELGCGKTEKTIESATIIY